MEPIQLGPLTVYPFGLFIAVLLIPFFVLVSFRMKKNGLKQGTASWFALLSLPLCVILAHLLYCLMSIDMLIDGEDLGLFWRFPGGGYFIWGAIAGLFLAALFTGKITTQSGAAIMDCAAVPTLLMIAAIRLLAGLLFRDNGVGVELELWFDPEETDFANRLSVFRLEDWSFFERFPFAVQDYYDVWVWAVFSLQALFAALAAIPVSRMKNTAPGGKATLFLLLYACGSLLMECMLIGGEIVYLPFNGFVKVNELFCAVAILSVFGVCIRRLPKGQRLKPALVALIQFLLATGIIVVMEFAAFEKKIPEIAWLPADGCHLLVLLACCWMFLALRPVWKKAYVYPAVE